MDTDLGLRFPVQITTSETRIVWVEAESQAQAVKATQDDPEWYEIPGFKEAEVIEYSVDADPPESWHWEGAVYPSSPESWGPFPICPVCENPPHSRRIHHKPQCPIQRAADIGRAADNAARTALRAALRLVWGR
jgi:hypothetical protein